MPPGGHRTARVRIRSHRDFRESTHALQIGPSQWQQHNALVNQIPDYVPNSAVISSEGTAIHDIAHFDEASARIMGERYVEKFLEMVPEP